MSTRPLTHTMDQERSDKPTLFGRGELREPGNGRGSASAGGCACSSRNRTHSDFIDSGCVAAPPVNPRRPTRLAVHGALLAALLASTAAAETAPSYVTSWVGNTCGGAKDQWVQGHVQDMAVTPGGRVFATTWWDEDGKECGVYENGKLIGNLASGRHDAGRAIAANATGVYVAKGGFGKSTPDLRRFDPSTFALADNRRFPIGAGKLEVRGLAATDALVYAAIPGDNVVRVLDAKTMAEQSSFTVERPGKLAIAKDGTLWIVQLAEKADKGVKVLHYAAGGSKLPEEVVDVVDIQALAAAPDGRLLLGENGPDNQVLIYDVSGQPRRVGAFGQKGGILAGKPGEVQPDKFDGISGLGVDAKDNLYVACDGRLSGSAASDGNGTVLRAFAPAGELLWELLALEFVDTVVVDPASDGADVYSDFHHYRLDLAKPAGQEWSWWGRHFDRFRSNDWRISTKHHYALAMCRIEGQLFLYATAQWPHWVGLYRFEGEQAIPCGRFIGLHEKNKPWAEFPGEVSDDLRASGRFGSIWVDADGDGLVQGGECAVTPTTWHWGRFVDSKGGYWGTSKGGIMHIPCVGLNPKGCPVYRTEDLRSLPKPAELTEISRVAYVPEEDALYLLGFTKAHPRRGGDDREVGRDLVRMDNPLGKAEVRWTVSLAKGEGGALEGKDKQAAQPAGLTAIPGFVFVGGVNPPEVHAFRADDGAPAQRFKPGREVGGISGWMDIPNPITAFRRKDGEVLVFAEEDARHKVLMYRWRPPAK